ncbi:excision repair protein ERCC-1 [Seminavis robusta]|uniref:Excision repair protein ERCC-1 n=1 Tax=Seminavis robusta TaxID=568900 RepID=A0A9N8DZI2_9STRA|nr:excision repair protein ERCC-1 [Seminavis robusta]|eukprot:Sro414_g138280.1 excision repair protein ERCC-1 (428) ;mRNA; r:37646-39026
MASTTNPSSGQQKPPPSGGPTNENRGGGSGNIAAVARARNPYAAKKNPYASKKPKTAATSAGTSIGTSSKRNNPTTNDNDRPQKRADKPQIARDSQPPALQAFAGSSFSQAFGAIDETEYFQQATADGKNAGANNAHERAEQRAFEDTMTDRDHHAMIQPHVLSVSTKQRGNGILNFIRNVPFAYSRMVPDYLLSPTSCALFLSLKYHNLHPQYIHKRIAELRTDFQLRVLLVLVDMDDNQSTLLYLNKLAVQQNFTMILAWTEEEAARYLESYKALDGNDCSLIMRKEKTNFADQAADFLAGGTGVNKTDAASLLSQFSSVKAIMAATKDELGMVPGLGQVKVTRLHDAFHKPFSSKRQRERKEKAEKEAASGSEKDDTGVAQAPLEGNATEKKGNVVAQGGDASTPGTNTGSENSSGLESEKAKS